VAGSVDDPLPGRRGYGWLFTRKHHRNPPWQERLLALYLLAILIVLLVRAIQLVLCLRALHKKGPAAKDGWDMIWTLGKLRACSLMRLATLTFFLCILEMSIGVTNDLWAVGTQKVAHSWWLLVEVAEGLAAFNVGMVTCVLLYACGFFFESRLERRKLALQTASVPSRTPTS
jgi:hypothetical protein